MKVRCLESIAQNARNIANYAEQIVVLQDRGATLTQSELDVLEELESTIVRSLHGPLMIVGSAAQRANILMTYDEMEQAIEELKKKR